MALACLAALFKLSDLPAFLASLTTWRMIPSWARVPLSVVVPIVELGAGTLWFLGLCRRTALTVVWVGLFAVTAVYTLHVAFLSPADCNCFGTLLRFERWENQAWAVIGRNTLLLIGLGAAGVLWWRQPKGRPQQPAGRTESAAPRRSHLSN